jgi:aldose 1-epimerase
MTTGALARVLPGFGANCMELRLPDGEDGPVVAVIDDMKHLDKLEQQPSRYGIPVLFPWPSGIPDGRFLFEGNLYSMNGPGETGARHHGFVSTAKWRVVRSDCDNTGAWVTCAVDSKDCGEIAQRYPSQFTLEMTFRLGVGGFHIDMAARNTGTRNMPMGMGLHPYFSLPFGSKGSAGACKVVGDVGRQWDLEVTVPFSAGDARPERVFQPAPKYNFVGDIDGGAALAGKKLNEVFEAAFDNKDGIVRVSDPANGVLVEVSASPDFGTWVFYTPPDRDAVSIEPWTLTPNGFNLAAAGVEEAGMITLAPGQAWSGRVAITLKQAPEERD